MVLDFDKLGVIGLCFGGGMVLELVRSGALLKGFVFFYVIWICLILLMLRTLRCWCWCCMGLMIRLVSGLVWLMIWIFGVGFFDVGNVLLIWCGDCGVD